MAKMVGVKEAHQQLTKLIRAAEEGDQIVITREGIPVAILLGADEYNSIIATLEEMADPGALRALREAQADAKAGRVHAYEDVFGRRPLRETRKRHQ
jgi:antitoxin YefM